MVCSSVYFTSKARAARLARGIEIQLSLKGAEAGLIRLEGMQFEWRDFGHTGLRLCFLGVPLGTYPADYCETWVPALESLYEATLNTEGFAC